MRNYFSLFFLLFSSLAFSESITLDGRDYRLFDTHAEAKVFCQDGFPYDNYFKFGENYYPYLDDSVQSGLGLYTEVNECMNGVNDNLWVAYKAYVPTLEEQCLADGDYWYNSQCNSSPEPIVSACVSGAGSNVIKTLEGGDFSIPSNICLDVPELSESCTFMLDGTGNSFSDGSGSYWAANFYGAGEGCTVPTVPTPVDHDCSGNELFVYSDTGQPSGSFSLGLCDYSYSDTEGTNSYNGCTSYHYVASSYSLGDQGQDFDSYNHCNFTDSLTCDYPKVLSEDGLSCVDTTNDLTGEGFSLLIYNGTENPYQLFTLVSGHYKEILDVSQGEVTLGATNYLEIDTSIKYTKDELFDVVIDQYDDYDHFDPTYSYYDESSSMLKTVVFRGLSINEFTTYISVRYRRSVYGQSSGDPEPEYLLDETITIANYNFARSGFTYDEDQNGPGTASGAASSAGSSFDYSAGRWDSPIPEYSDSDGGFMPPTFAESFDVLKGGFLGVDCSGGAVDCVPSQGSFELAFSVDDAQCEDFSLDVPFFGGPVHLESSICDLLLDPDYEPWFHLAAYIFYVIATILLVFAI